MSLPKEIIEYLETLIIGQGRHAGKPFKVLPWQSRFIRGAFHPDNDGKDAGLSVARGNGKSTLVAGLGCAALNGPLAEPMGECLILAGSFEQGKSSIFKHAIHFLKPEFEKGGTGPNGAWRVQDSSNRASIEYRKTGANAVVLGNDSKKAHGRQPVISFLDEMAQWDPGKIDKTISAIKTARGKVPGSRSIWLGTRPDSEGHQFEKFLQSGNGYRQIHAVSKDVKNPLWRKHWFKANPSLKHMPDLLTVLIEEAADAKRNPADYASFLSLRLNMGTPDTVSAVLLPAQEWLAAESRTNDGRIGDYVLGIDLGGGTSMSAAAGYWLDTGWLEGFACIGAIPNLSERGRRDGVANLYNEMHDRGELIPCPGRVPDIEQLLLEAKSRWGYPCAIVCDRWREKELRDALDEVRFPRRDFVSRGMGYKDGAEDVRLFKKSFLKDQVTPEKSLLLRSGMREARIVSDPAANQKLAKGNQGGRRLEAKDDVIAASILAVAEGSRILRKKRNDRGPGYLVIS